MTSQTHAIPSAFRRIALPLLPLLAVTTACVSAGPASGPDRGEVAKVTAMAAEQVKRCYRQPRVASIGRQIITRLLVRYAPDGSLAEMPTLLGQAAVTPANEAYAGRMAQAAVQSVLKCAPLTLPPNLYERGWAEFELTFSPLAAA